MAFKPMPCLKHEYYIKILPNSWMPITKKMALGSPKGFFGPDTEAKYYHTTQ
jgi:hypothetical protein